MSQLHNYTVSVSLGRGDLNDYELKMVQKALESHIRKYPEHVVQATTSPDALEIALNQVFEALSGQPEITGRLKIEVEKMEESQPEAEAQ